MLKRLRNAWEGFRCDSAIFCRNAHMTINTPHCAIEVHKNVKAYFNIHNVNFNGKPNEEATIILKEPCRK